METSCTKAGRRTRNKGTFKNTGGTGKYEGASGGGTYTLDDKGFKEPLSGGTYNGTIQLRD